MTIDKVVLAVGSVLALTIVSPMTAGAQAADEFGATRTGYFLTGKRSIPVSRAISYDLTKERALARRSGVVVAGSGGRPGIATVRSTGAVLCRTAGILPPLGVGRFGEPSIGGLPICPTTPGQPAPAVPPPPTPLEAAYYAWLYVIDLPSPTASTQPAVGITGLDTFLTIHGEQRIVRDISVLGHHVHFEITSVYDVDWGDPRPDGTRTGTAVTRNHKDQGGPFPSGTLRHQYVERGSATISITQRWSATWSTPTDGGSLPDSVETTGSLTLPIQEIQAVVTG